MISNKRTTLFLACSTLLLAACDLPFIGDEEAKIEAKRQAEGQAVGSGCRYSSRPLEDCYGMNPKMSKAAIFNGWREMDGYMRENNIQAVIPEPPEASAKKAEVTEKIDKVEKVEEKPKAAEATPAAEAPKSATTTRPPPPASKAGIRPHKQPKHIA